MKLEITLKEDGKLAVPFYYVKYAPIDLSMELRDYIERTVIPKITDILHEELLSYGRNTQ